MSQQLSRSFWLHEFTRSQTAARLGRDIVPDATEIEALTKLCMNVLQPLRDAIGVTITINSGLRPAWLNPLVGGSKTSQHMKGEAADIIAQGFPPFELCREITNLGLPFDQLILEFDQWSHVSYSSLMRGVVLTARIIEGKTVYLPGLVPRP
jgi:hypothetical protein